MHPASPRAIVALLLVAVALVVAGCGGGTTAEPATAETQVEATAAPTLLAPQDAEALIAGDGDVRVLDVRTPEEYAEGHVAGATLIDFYAPDFADRIAELDREATYVVYCRSGNRSGQATALMAQQGFASVNDVDGGVVAWEAAGLPLER